MGFLEDLQKKVKGIVGSGKESLYVSNPILRANPIKKATPSQPVFGIPQSPTPSSLPLPVTSTARTTPEQSKETLQEAALKVVKGGTNVAKFGKDFLQGTTRAVGSVAITAGNAALPGQPFPSEIDPKVNKFSRAILGDTTVKDLPTYGKAGLDVIEQVTGKKLSEKYAFPLAGLGILTELSGTSKPIKSLIKESLEATTKKQAFDALKRAGISDEIITANNLDNLIAGAKDEDTVRAVLSTVPETQKFTVPKTQKVSKVTDEIVDTIPRTADGEVDAFKYADLQNAARETARETRTIGDKLASAKNEIFDKMVDFTGPIQRAYKKGIKTDSAFAIGQIDKANVDDYTDRVFNAPAITTGFLKEKGFDEVVQTVGKENLGYFDQYLIARRAQDLRARGKATGRDTEKLIKADEAVLKQMGPRFEEQAKKIDNFVQARLDYMVDAGLLSAKQAKTLREVDPRYVPFQRTFTEDELMAMGGTNGSRGVASNSGSGIEKMTGSVRQIESPLESLLATTEQMIVRGEKNKAAKMLASYKDIKGNPFGLTPLRTTENVTDRIEIFKKLKESKPYRDRLQRLLRTDNSVVRSLKSELNQLNKSGIRESLKKKDAPFLQKKTSSAIQTKVTPDELIDKRPRSFDEISTSYTVKAILKKEFGNYDNLLTEIKGGGWSHLIDVGVNKTSAESIAKQIFKEPVFKPGTRTMKDIFVTTSNSETRKLIENLIADPDPSKLASIKRKIGNREPKVTILLNEIESLQQAFNKVKKERGDLFDEASLAKDAKSRGKATISFYDNGIKNIYEVNAEIAKAAKALDVQRLNIFGKILAAPLRVARIGITGIAPGFVAKNVVRDQVSAFVLSQNGLRSSIANPRVWTAGLAEALKHGKLYDEIVGQGALMTSVDYTRDALKPTLKQIAESKTKFNNVVFNAKNPKKWFSSIEDIISRSEQVTRIQQYKGAFEAAIERGVDVETAKILAARAARENSTNFARRGEWGTVMNNVFLYLNAGIQGSRRMIRAFQKNPKATTAKVALTYGMPTAAFTYWNLSDPKRKEVYDDLQDWEKETSMIIIPPNPTKDENGRWNVIKIPLQPGMGEFANGPRRAIEASFGGDPVGFGEAAARMLATVQPVNTQNPLSQAVPQAIKPSIEVATNKSLFTGAPIVPRNLEGLDPSVQYFSKEEGAKKNTSGTAKLLADTLGISPIKTEYFINSTLGSVSRNILNASDKALAKTGAIDPNQIGGEDVRQSISKGFTSASGGKKEGEVLEKIYDASRESKTESEVLKREGYKLYKSLSDLPPEEANAQMKQIKAENPKLFKEIKDAKEAADLNLSAEEKALKQAPVTDGTRAQLIFDQAKKIRDEEGPEAANAYIADLREKRVISKEVLKQMKDLAKK